MLHRQCSFGHQILMVCFPITHDRLAVVGNELWVHSSARTGLWLTVEFPAYRAFLVVKLVKNLPAIQETPVHFLGGEDPLEKGMATHSSILTWRIPWTQEPGRLQSMGSQWVGHNWVTKHKIRQMDHGISAKHLWEDILYGLLVYEPSHRWDVWLKSSLPSLSCFLTLGPLIHWQGLPHHGVHQSSAGLPLTCMIPWGTSQPWHLPI